MNRTTDHMPKLVVQHEHTSSWKSYYTWISCSYTFHSFYTFSFFPHTGFTVRQFFQMVKCDRFWWISAIWCLILKPEWYLEIFGVNLRNCCFCCCFYCPLVPLCVLSVSIYILSFVRILADENGSPVDNSNNNDDSCIKDENINKLVCCLFGRTGSDGWWK